MYIYSQWILTDAKAQDLTEFISQVGNGALEPVENENGSIFTYNFPYENLNDSYWDLSKTRGSWTIGMALLPPVDEANRRLVGLISPSASLTHHLASLLRKQLIAERSQYDTARFALGSLLSVQDSDNDSAWPTSVRVSDDSTRILVQSNKGENLREALTGLAGRSVGVTMRSKDGQATVTDEEGTVTFSAVTAPDEVLKLMQVIQHSMPVRMIEWA